MKSGVLNAAGWVLVGMILMGLLVWFTMPSLMLIKHKSSRGYDDTVAVLSDALRKKQDWRVLTVNDYQKSTAAFGAIERVGSVTICNPRTHRKFLLTRLTAVLPHSCPWGLVSMKTNKGRYMSHS